MNRFKYKKPATARLFVVRGVATTKNITVPLPCLIGRGRNADLFVGSMLISRNHCRLDLMDGKVYITDLGSRNGTLLNNKPIPENIPVELNNQSLITIGSLTFQFEFQPTEVFHFPGQNTVNRELSVAS